MRFVIQLFFIALAAFLLELWLSWWSVAIAAALGGFIFRSRANFLAGFLGIALLWFSAAWWIELSTVSDLSDRVAAIFGISKTVLLVVTCSLGGLTGGFAALTGSLLRKPRRRSRHYA